jgi:hypothetical protein
MIFFYGMREPHIKSTVLEYETCPECGQQGSIVSSVYGRYAHLFWIPLFPLTKKTYTQCRECNHQFYAYQMPESIGKEVQQFSRSVRTPIWYFSGLILFAVLIAFVVYSGKMDDKNTAAYMSDPQIHDCYYIRYSDDGYYSTMRIEAIEGDSVYFSVNDYATSKYSDIEKINIEENFDAEDLYPVAKEDLDLKNVEGVSLRRIRRER